MAPYPYCQTKKYQTIILDKRHRVAYSTRNKFLGR